jgi:hypothetical protein
VTFTVRPWARAWEAAYNRTLRTPDLTEARPAGEIEADEDSQGGTGVTAELQGQIVGDPMLQFTDATLAPVQTNLLDPGSPPGLSGVVGSEAAAGVIPEPSTWAMMLLGFAGLGYAGYRRTREPRAA